MRPAISWLGKFGREIGSLPAWSKLGKDCLADGMGLGRPRMVHRLHGVGILLHRSIKDLAPNIPFFSQYRNEDTFAPPESFADAARAMLDRIAAVGATLKAQRVELVAA